MRLFFLILFQIIGKLKGQLCHTRLFKKKIRHSNKFPHKQIALICRLLVCRLIKIKISYNAPEHIVVVITLVFF